MPRKRKLDHPMRGCSCEGHKRIRAFDKQNRATTVHSVAVCHPDRELVSRGLCRKCYAKKWDNENREKRLQIRARRIDKANITRRAWKARNAERIAATSRAAHARRRHDPSYRELYRQQNARRRARLIAAPINDLTIEQWVGVLDSYFGRCAYCGAPARDQDHVVPLSIGGSHTASNVVPACRSCNARKHDRVWTPNIPYATFPQPARVSPSPDRYPY